jgi:ornithine cyclodeaminase
MSAVRMFDERATREALPFGTLIESLRTMFRQGCTVPERHVHRIDGPEGQGTSLIMPAWNERYFGIKTVNVFPGNALSNRPALHSTYQLFDARTGAPIALMDGDVITSRRTAAASALAASYLAPKTSRRLLVVGAGRVGSLLAEAYGTMFDLDEVAVWTRSAPDAAALAERLRRAGIRAVDAPSLPEAASRADIVSCATLATQPIVRGAWLNLEGHLDLIGSFTPQMREADDDAFRSAAVFVDTREALGKSGDLLGPLSSGVLSKEDIAGTLSDLCTGKAMGDIRPKGRTVFKSVGTALEDLAAAIQVFESAGVQ